MLALQSYASSDDDDDSSEEQNTATISQQPVSTEILPYKPPENSEYSIKRQLEVCAAPVVLPTVSTQFCYCVLCYKQVGFQNLQEGVQPIDPRVEELNYNPKYEQLFAPVVGPENPFKSTQQQATRNMLSGYVEPAHLSEFQFENQRRTFNSFGYALDPSVNTEDGDANKVCCKLCLLLLAEFEKKNKFFRVTSQ